MSNGVTLGVHLHQKIELDARKIRIMLWVCSFLGDIKVHESMFLDLETPDV